MVKTPFVDLHCGACQTSFVSEADLSRHLDICPAVKNLLPIVNRTYLIGDETGHPLGSLLFTASKNAPLIRRYCYAVAYDMPSWERTKLHREVCEKLNLVHADFRPFESEEITKIPTPLEAEEIFWKALRQEAEKIIQSIPYYATDAESRKRLTLDFFDPSATPKE